MQYAIDQLSFTLKANIRFKGTDPWNPNELLKCQMTIGSNICILSLCFVRKKILFLIGPFCPCGQITQAFTFVTEANIK